MTEYVSIRILRVSHERLKTKKKKSGISIINQIDRASKLKA